MIMWEERFRKEVDDIEVPENEVNHAIHLGLAKGRKTQRMKRKSKVKVSVAILTTAVTLLIAAFITLNFSSPSFAEKIPIIGGVFELFKEDNNNYIFDEYSENSAEIATTVESSGVNITITDAVYDKGSITVAYTMKSEEGLGEEPFLDGAFLVEEFERAYTPGRFITEQVSETEYAGIFVMYLMNGKKPEQVHVKWNGNRIRRSFDELELDPIEGNWSFEFTLDALESETIVFEDLLTDEQGIRVKLTKMTTSPVANNFYMSQVIDEDLNGWEEESWEYVFIDYLVSDNLGNEYNVLPNAGYGDSKYRTTNRFSIGVIDEKATSLHITPEVVIYNKKQELARDPFKIETIEVSLE